MRPQALLAWSGGKDAAWALHLLRRHGGIEVVGLLTTITGGDERSAMQGVGTDVLRAQANAAGLPLIEARLPAGADNATYTAGFAEVLERARARWPGIAMVAFGDLFLADIRAWREALCASLGWTPLFPLFGLDTATLARDMLAGGLRADLCCVDTTRLDASLAGRPFDATLLATLPPGIDPCGEHGEFHTCVHAGPMFDAPVALVRGDAWVRDGRFACVDFQLAG